MFVDERIKALDCKGRDFPILRGDVKLTLKNIYNGKTETVESHNVITDALSDIFGGNYGGLVNYQNFADLYKTYLGGVLLFRDQLDLTTPEAYGIPSESVNPCVAHAGQEPLTSQQDDYKRGNPDDTGTLVLENSTKLTFVWSPSAGNAPKINSLALTHSDVGSYGCGVVSQAQKSLVPFADVGAISRSYSYSNDANAVLGINGNTAYTFYKTSGTTVDIYKTPINNSKFKLQGGSLLPLTDYTTKITVTLPSSYGDGTGACYYHWDFTNNNLILFGVPTNNGTTLYMDVISLSDGSVTHTDITVTGANLWRFHSSTRTGYSTGNPMTIPTKAILYNNHLFVYGNEYNSSVNGYHPTKMFIVNLANTADITEVDTTDLGESLDGEDTCATAGRVSWLGGIIANDSFLVNGDKMFPLTISRYARTTNRCYVMPNSISSPMIGINRSDNMVSVCKLYLATKYNLPSEIQKTASQSMTVEYTLTEI